MTAERSAALAELEAEMARQHADARDLVATTAPMAQQIAASVIETGRLLLVGMGTSHFANRVAEVVLRAGGIDATAITASEFLLAPETPPRRTLLLVSQSGESGEVVAWLDRRPDGGHEFGLTLSPDSRLARSRPCILAPGGSEKAFAATRSFFLTVTGLAVLCEALEADGGGFERVTAGPDVADVEVGIAHLAAVDALAVSARGALQGIAEAAALNLMELGRKPALALEGGQFRHGPMEILGPRLGVLMLRADDAHAERVAALATAAAEAGSPTVVIDTSGRGPVAGTVTLRLPQGAGFAACLGLLPTLQRLVIGLAGRFVPDVGRPVRSTKVTRGE
jgi:fructoselysine-6-P-deglycase FrlB-like protein